MIFMVIVSFVLVTEASDSEKQLRDDLFRSYNVDVRPVSREELTVNLSLDVALFQIIKLKEKDQTLEVSAWLRQTWHDHSLMWDPKDYAGIKQINIRPKKVWLPDIVLYNNVIEDNAIGGHLDKLHTRIIIHHDGRVQWTASAILKTHCNIKVRYFPFDSQHCSLKFVSWTYSLPFLNISFVHPYVDTANYESNSEWELTGTFAVRKDEKYKCCEHKFADIHFHLRLSRRSLFYLLNLVFPISVITMLTILSFLLPAESGERISLAVTLLLAVTVFMLIVADVTPATSEEIPLVSLYFIVSMIDMVILMITVCYVNRLHHKQQSDGPMSYWTRRIILENLSYILRIQRRPPIQTNQDLPNNYLMHKVETEIDSNGVNGHAITLETKNIKNCLDAYTFNYNVSNDTKELAKVIQNMGEQLTRRLDSLASKVADDNNDDLIKTEWRIVAMTVDRSLLLFFLLNFVLTLMAVFSLSPGYVA